MVYALLSDTAGFVLIARRRGSVLWTLPGGKPRPPGDPLELLGSYCQRQIGMAPEFQPSPMQFTFAGATVLVGLATVPRARVGPRGRLEAVQWVLPSDLPCETDPTVRMAIGLHAQFGLAPSATGSSAPGTKPR